jgi:gliding motility-associated-like protein
LPVTLVISSANGCVDTLQRQVVIPLIEANPADTVIACAGEAVGLYPGANPSYSYQWSPPGLLSDPTAANPLVILQQTTVFTATITDAQGACEVTRTVTAVAPPALTAAVPADTIVCEPTVTLQAQSEQAAFIHWFDTPALINPIGAGNSASVMPGRPSTYYIRFIDDYGCVLVDSVSVGSYAISVLLEGATTICIGDTAQLLATNLTGDALTYNWSPLEGIIAGENTYSPLVSPSVSTTYQLSVSNAYGCSLDTGVVVNIFNYVPPVSAFAEPDTLATGESSQLTAEPAEGYTYLWSPAGTLDNPLIPNPVATPLETTTYKVTVRDPSGCINSALVTIVVFDPVCREPNIYVPNGFSPNGDGLNEILYVRGNAIDEMYFAVYNRWGEKVFESRSPEVGWDGTFRGKLLEPEVFGYFLEVNCLNGETYFKKGNITLIR